MTIDAAHRIIVGYTEKARTKTVGYQQKEQRIGAGGKPMRVGISEYHFRAAVTEQYDVRNIVILGIVSTAGVPPLHGTYVKHIVKGGIANELQTFVLLGRKSFCAKARIARVLMRYNCILLAKNAVITHEDMGRLPATEQRCCEVRVQSLLRGYA